ncbi:unnamed protein product, partial [Ectocarpus sp. 12 AP-2014]
SDIPHSPPLPAPPPPAALPRCGSKVAFAVGFALPPPAVPHPRCPGCPEADRSNGRTVGGGVSPECSSSPPSPSANSPPCSSVPKSSRTIGGSVGVGAGFRITCP